MTVIGVAGDVLNAADRAAAADPVSLARAISDLSLALLIRTRGDARDLGEMVARKSARSIRNCRSIRCGR